MMGAIWHTSAKIATLPQQWGVVAGENSRLAVKPAACSHHGLGASTIAAIDKDRWQIELFFKALKQNLKIKTFVGTSTNAGKTQMWTAVIAMGLLRSRQRSSRFGWSLANLVAFA